MNRMCFLAVAVALVGCSTSPEQPHPRDLPEAWQHSPSLSNCGSTDGRFDEHGEPAPANSQAEARSLWPKMGSLSSMVSTGANGMPRRDLATVGIEIVDGHPRFKAYADNGTEVPVMEREWWCEEKALMTRTVLGTVESEGVPEVRDESVLRLWRATDGALIAEQRLESITPGSLGSSPNHQLVTRTYFRFPAVTPAATQ
jgi:hypothetical protein